MKIVEADQAGLGPYMMIPVHDEIDFDVPNDEFDDIISTIKTVMNDDQLLSVPITSSIDLGLRWGECA
jgi:DNA polymerase I-like protein with 3'-5' exonuclease and polymerase domains